MKGKSWFILGLSLLVFLSWGLSGPGKDFVMVKVQTEQGFRWDTLYYRLKGTVIRGQGLIGDSAMVTAGDNRLMDTGLVWFRAACSEFPIGSRILVTNAVNHFKVAAIITHRMKSQRNTGGMRLSIEPEAAAVLHFDKEAVNQIRVQLLDSLRLMSSRGKDSLVSGNRSLSEPIRDSASGYQFNITGRQIRGIASFYSLNLDGTLTATGEKFRNEKLTAASNNLPLNTWVRVTNQRNGNSVILRINDRMHPRMAKKGRVVDLSFRAARALDFVEAGLTKVTVEVLQVLPKKLNTQPVTLPAMPASASPESLKNGKDSIVPVPLAFRGMATVYTPAYSGRKTQSGSIYRPGLMTAAANRVEIGTRLKVTSLDTGQWIEVLVNDRLPAAADKTIVVQLSEQAAKMLSFNPKNRHKVEVLPLFSPQKNK